MSTHATRARFRAWEIIRLNREAVAHLRETFGLAAADCLAMDLADLTDLIRMANTELRLLNIEQVEHIPEVARHES